MHVLKNMSEILYSLIRSPKLVKRFSVTPVQCNTLAGFCWVFLGGLGGVCAKSDMIIKYK